MRKPYKIPQGYISWGKFQQHKDLFSLITPKKVDYANNFNTVALKENLAYLYQFWAKGYPVYCVRKTLLEDMQKTDVGENLALFSDIHLAIPSYVLFFPQYLVKSPTQGGKSYIDYMVINQEEVASKDYKYVVSWGGIDSTDSIFLGSKGIRHDGTINHSKFSTENKEQQNTALELRNLALQSILLLQYYPDIESKMLVLPGKGKGFNKPSSIGIATDYLLPRWLGKEREQTPQAPTNAAGNNSSKSPHFRRGHWRVQPCGEGRKDNKVTWVRPAWIAGNN